jgi:hypothetical protein
MTKSAQHQILSFKKLLRVQRFFLEVRNIEGQNVKSQIQITDLSNMT